MITSRPRRSARCSSGRRGVHWGLPILPVLGDDGRRAAPGIPRRPRRVLAVACPSSSAADHARGNPHVQGPGLRSPDVLLHGRVRPPGRSRARAVPPPTSSGSRRTGSRWSASTSRRSPPPSSGTRWSRRPSAAVTTRRRSCSSTARSPQGRYPAREVLGLLVGVAAPKTKEGPDACRAPAEAAPDALGGSLSSKKCC